MFDVKEEGESDVALSHLLTEENLRQINRRRQLALLLLSFCSTVPFVVLLYRYLYFYFVVFLFRFDVLYLKQIREQRAAKLIAVLSTCSEIRFPFCRFVIKEETCGEINCSRFLSSNRFGV